MKQITVASPKSRLSPDPLTFAEIPGVSPQPWAVYACDLATHFKVPVEIWENGNLSLIIRP